MKCSHSEAKPNPASSVLILNKQLHDTTESPAITLRMYELYRIKRVLLVLLSLVALSVFSQSEEETSDSSTLTLGTWNLSNLSGDDEGLQPRNFDDFRVLARYARALDADIVGVQEVADEESLTRVFGGSYDIHLSKDESSQRTGFAIRKEVEFTALADFADLATSPGLPSGTQIALDLKGQTIRLMSVQLQSGCFDEDSEDAQESAQDCERLEEQVTKLSEWLEQTASETELLIVLGDFNRRLTDRDGDWILDELSATFPLESAMKGYVPLCWSQKFEQYTDHFLISEKVQKLVVLNSFREVTYAASNQRTVAIPQGGELLYPSDHCPITIKLEY